CEERREAPAFGRDKVRNATPMWRDGCAALALFGCKQVIGHNFPRVEHDIEAGSKAQVELAHRHRASPEATQGTARRGLFKSTARLRRDV
ncbi:hypothetical protein HAX54_021848, partial [Datura stramonium]|nr:hypothetical protein [Datura stramonium]